MKIGYTVSMALLSGTLVFCVAGIFSYYKDARTNEKEMEEVIREVTYESVEVRGGERKEIGEKIEDVQIDFGKLKEFNADTVGWIRFYDQCVNYPLVQTEDNSYYLNHSFKKEKNAAGCLFMDCRNESFEDKNVVIYGHNMIDHTMFGSLKDVFQDDFWEEENRDIIWIVDTDHCLRKYKIFSYYIVEDEDYYITTSFTDDTDYVEFLHIIKDRSFEELDVSVTADDHILTLSTCAGAAGTGQRRVIHAKLF